MPWRRRRETRVEEGPPVPPPRPLLWPWLLLLLLLVAGGIGLAYFLSRDGDDDGGDESQVPAVVGLRVTEAVERLRASGYPADARRRVEPSRRGRVVEQEPDGGTELERGRTVVIVVARGRNTVDVPDVVGLPVADAFERVQAARLRARSVEAFSRQARGRVFRQRPTAREEAPRGSLVVLTVSRGPQLVRVPAVVGRTETQASAALRTAGLRPSVVRVPSREPRGRVVEQNPAPAARAPRGSSVRINVSQGTPPPATTTPTTGQGTVPDVIGLRGTDAITRIQQAGFRVSTTSVTSTQPAGTVLRQSPAGGTRARRGSTVGITLSGGPRTRTVPDVVGETEGDARRILREAGFRVRVLGRAVTDPAREGIVVEQVPRAGARVRSGTEVVIYVGRLA
jgi:eukaryotic-like serine/threonine-protein kinase